MELGKKEKTLTNAPFPRITDITQTRLTYTLLPHFHKCHLNAPIPWSLLKDITVMFHHVHRNPLHQVTGERFSFHQDFGPPYLLVASRSMDT